MIGLRWQVRKIVEIYKNIIILTLIVKRYLFLNIIFIFLSHLTLFASKTEEYSSLFSKENSVYYITHDYNLDSESVNVGENSVLFFLGGSITNCTLILNNTRIKGWPKFKNCKLEGTIANQRECAKF